MEQTTGKEIDFITGRHETALYKCFQRYLPTKQGHNYLPVYDRYFAPVRHDVRRVLEIGVETGTSLWMWRDYFPNAEIVGFDINPACKALEEDRIRIVIGDQSKTEDLAKLPTDFDIVIDDGSHVQVHQIETFKHLFRHHMQARGLYVVEDCIARFKTIDWFKVLGDRINHWSPEVPGKDWQRYNSFGPADDDTIEEYLIRNTLGVSIYRFMIVVDKGRNPEDGQAAMRIADPEMQAEINRLREELMARQKSETAG